MRDKNVPNVDARYWAAIVVASVLGTSFGDYVSNTLELGFGGAAATVGSVLAMIFIAERTFPWTSVGWYWGAIVFTRTAATCLGDFLSRTADLGNGPVSGIVAACLAVYLFTMWRMFGPNPLNGGIEGAPKRLPETNARYWATMLAVSVFGTTFGDFMGDDMGFGLAGASLVLGGLLAVGLFSQIRALNPNEMQYWAVIALVRAAGTCMADYITEEAGLDLGFGFTAALVATLLLAILHAPYRAIREVSPEVVGS